MNHFLIENIHERERFVVRQAEEFRKETNHRTHFWFWQQYWSYRFFKSQKTLSFHFEMLIKSVAKESLFDDQNPPGRACTKLFHGDPCEMLVARAGVVSSVWLALYLGTQRSCTAQKTIFSAKSAQEHLTKQGDELAASSPTRKRCSNVQPQTAKRSWIFVSSSPEPAAEKRAMWSNQERIENS